MAELGFEFRSDTKAHSILPCHSVIKHDAHGVFWAYSMGMAGNVERVTREEDDKVQQCSPHHPNLVFICTYILGGPGGWNRGW